MSRDQKELVSFLGDMYSVEQRVIAQLISAPALAGDRQFSNDLRRHYAETEQHLRLVRERLDAHEKKVSIIKTVIMKAAGKAFLPFALTQPETPRKLAVHSYSYEAMEWAGYEILRRFALLVDDPQTLAVAFSIRDQEHAMMERLERDFDAAEEFSHGNVYPEALRNHLRNHLREAHVLEVQGCNLLQKTRVTTSDPLFAEVCSQNLQESRKHARILQEQLALRGAKPLRVEDCALGRDGWSWNFFFKLYSDTPVKLATRVYAHEQLRAAAYEFLGRTAKRAGDTETEELCAQLASAQRAMAERVPSIFDSVVQTTLGG